MKNIKLYTIVLTTTNDESLFKLRQTTNRCSNYDKR